MNKSGEVTDERLREIPEHLSPLPWTYRSVRDGNAVGRRDWIEDWRAAMAWGLLGLAAAIVAPIALRPGLAAPSAHLWLAGALATGAALALLAWIVIERNRRK